MEYNSCEFIRTCFFTHSQHGVTFSILNPPMSTRWNEFMISLKKKIRDVLVQVNKGILSGFLRLKIKGSTPSFCHFLCTSLLWQFCHRFNTCDEVHLHVKLQISVMYVLSVALQKNFTLLYLNPSGTKPQKKADLMLFSAKSYPTLIISLGEEAQLLSLWFNLQPLMVSQSLFREISQPCCAVGRWGHCKK